MPRGTGTKKVGKAGFMTKKQALKRFGSYNAKKYFG